MSFFDSLMRVVSFILRPSILLRTKDEEVVRSTFDSVIDPFRNQLVESGSHDEWEESTKGLEI